MSCHPRSHKMLRVRRYLQIFLMTSLCVCATLFLFHRKTFALNDPARAQEVGWQERAPRSLSGDYDNNLVEVLRSTATPVPSTLSVRDLFISVKTTVHYHQARLPVILKTWFQLAKQQTWFFTDADDEEFQKKTNGHMVNTNCSSSHNRKALCCKMSVELDSFLESNKKWFCHFDDDNYVNVNRLVHLLGDYSHQEDWYLGKPSIRTPLEILNREPKPQKKQHISFWFATGGAGFCLSRALALKMMPIASGGRFMGIGEKIRLPDDVTMGYIIEHLLKKPLTVVDQFHSHLEPMKFIAQDTFHDQITFSYSKYSKDEMNVVRIDGFDTRIDPTRFLSLHCYLFPYFQFCPR
ncbi:fringe glycosyltransferase [Cimex lectularius]|uniref:Fringe-like glycosyltransferase domain-containing protein n=1 Tax=Cimex lectularius TaxID=79782 RepID=A0A8I6TCZ0_CIMLE|nr:fringe glycosyltransferase [Cimex lectularius]